MKIIKNIFYLFLVILFSFGLGIFITSCGSNGGDLLDNLTGQIGTLQGQLSSLASNMGNYMVVAQDTVTGTVYRAFTDSNGNFSINSSSRIAGIKNGGPEKIKKSIGSNATNSKAENSGSVIISIVGPDGQTVGTLSYGNAGQNEAITGINAESDVDFGVIDIPDDPTTEPIVPGNDLSNIADANITARVDANGVPVGIDSTGKGADDIASQLNSSNVADKDSDGLIDILDADDDGDGIADDFDIDSNENATGNEDFEISIGQLLDIESSDYLDYYNTDEATKQAALVRDLRLDVWVRPLSNPNPPIIKVEVLEQPGPGYLPTLLTGPADNPYNWKDGQIGNGSDSYCLTPVPNSGDYYAGLMLPTGSTSFFKLGDTFVFKIWQGDNIDDPNATYTIVSRMLNYVFDYPSSYRYTSDPNGATPDDLIPYDPTVNTDVTFDGAKNEFVFVMAPPKDESGNPITTGGTFELKISYDDANGQIVYFDEDEIRNNPPADGWPVGWDGVRYTVNMSDLNYTYTGAPDPNTEMLFKVRVPMEVLPDTITKWDDPDGTNPTQVNVTSYGLGTRFIINDSIAQNSISMTKIINN